MEREKEEEEEEDVKDEMRWSRRLDFPRKSRRMRDWEQKRNSECAYIKTIPFMVRRVRRNRTEDYSRARI